MNSLPVLKGRGIIVFSVFLAVLFLIPDNASATSQWSRRTGLSCNVCHTVFPRLNSFGEDFLRNGYQMVSPRKSGEKSEYDVDGAYVEKVENLLGFRLNTTPFMLETKAFQKDSADEKTSRVTLGSPVWIQFFVAGPVYKDISFFSELEYAQSSFKFNWFYFNFTNLMESSWLNFQVGNISPVEFASYPDRLPQLSNIKGEVFHVLPSNGAGENSTKIRDAHPGIQYFGYNEWALFYAGTSPGKAARSISQYMEYWGGLVLKMSDNMLPGFEGSTATIHYQKGTDTKNTGVQAPEKLQLTNEWNRIVPSVNIRYKDALDLQAAYYIAEDKNWALVSNPPASFKFSGIAFEGGYMPNEKWHFGLHYDKYKSDDTNPATGKPIFEYQRTVPVVTYVVNQNIRFSFYYELDQRDLPSDQLSDKLYLNLRLML